MGPTKRQLMFEGAEAPPAHLALDEERLRRFLASRLNGLDGPLRIEKFKGGQSNPTYRVTGPGAAYVLRRKPPGAQVESAHAIDREFRILSALSTTAIPAPRPLLWCDEDEPSALGFAFYVVEHVPGRIFWDADLPGLTPSDRAVIYDEMNRVLAQLHGLDPQSIGLDDLSLRGGYARRNLERWSNIYRRSSVVEIKDMDWLIENLPAYLPAEGEASVIHGDYGLYNIILHPNEPRIVAVLDWEMATIGDPLIDLAHHLRPWWEVPDPSGAAASSLVDLDLHGMGIPDQRSYVRAYAERRGLSEPDLRFYLAFAQFRYAAMIQGILRRVTDGTASGRVVLHRQDRVNATARLARRTLEAIDGVSVP